MFAGLMLGNLATTQQWWENHGDGLLQANFNWFSPSRVIPKTINEFPAFSFLLSCFHAHVLTLAFTILAIGLAFNLFLAPYGLEGRGLHVFGERWQIPCTLFVTALVIGGLFVMNGWDYPTYMGLALVSIIIQQWLAHDTQFNVELFTNILIPAAFLVALSFILFIPFYRNFTSPSQGIGIVNATDRSNLSDELLIYGLFAFMYISLLVASVLKRPLFSLSELRKGGSNNSSTIGSDRFWFIISIVTTTALACIELALLIFMKNGVTFVITGSIALLGMIVLIVNLGDRAHSFALLLGATAFAVIAMCEVIFLKDVFADSFPRMNTVFKFYFQAWALLSITSGYGLFFLLENFFSFGLSSAPLRWLSRGGQVFWLTGLLALLLASMAYPLLAPTTRLAHYDFSMRKLVLTRTNSLDGLTYLQQCRPPDLDPDPTPFCTFDVRSDYAAIRWINANIQGDPTIVEAIGNDYTLYGRVSIFTGLPTLMGWGGHEVQWRTNWLNTPDHIGEFNQRYADVDLIYTNPDAQSVLATMAHYNAQYLYVGSLEHIKYPHANLERFGTFMQVVYNASGVTIYKVKDAGKG